MVVKTWLANEIAFTSTKEYSNPFEDVDLDVVFECGAKKLKLAAFWNGGKTWIVRFALPKAGEWTYTTVCSDEANEGLKQSGSVTCVPYDGEYEIYRRGFVKTMPDKRYFVYNDGTPFFYLGDTHWNFAAEEFDEPGEHAGDLKCESHFKYIVDRRCEQGFNVYQSEPIDAKYSVGGGLTEKDIPGFIDLDRRFKYIADKGMVHANAQLMFPQGIAHMARYDDKAYIKRLARFWAARYAAYPVMWTLGQEVDNDFYFNRGDQRVFEKEDNPFKVIAEGLYENDPYRHPLTGHMEFFSVIPGCAGDGTAPSTSAFRKVKGHDWYGYQWSRSLTAPIDYTFGKDGWLNGQGKVCILYESRYDGLWTKHTGARTQGWIAYLNGLYGYGYGAIDIWLYKSTYDIHRESNDGIDVITPEDKQTFWSKSVEYETAAQMGYMRSFFEKLQWWKLIPRFDSRAFFTPEKENYYSFASDERDTIVIYFFNINAFETGMLMQLDRCKYTYQWFNPRTGEYSVKREFYPDTFRSYKVEQKPDKMDWILLVQKA